MRRAAMIFLTITGKTHDMNALTYSENSGPASASWLKRLGTAGFAFFFVKGLLWLIVPSFLYLVR